MCYCVSAPLQTLHQVVPPILLSFLGGRRHSITYYERLFLSLISAANWHHDLQLRHKYWNISKDLCHLLCWPFLLMPDSYLVSFCPFVVMLNCATRELFRSDTTLFPSFFCYPISSHHTPSVSACTLYSPEKYSLPQGSILRMSLGFTALTPFGHLLTSEKDASLFSPMYFIATFVADWNKHICWI